MTKEHHYLRDYCYDRRFFISLYFITIGIFLLITLLYQMENAMEIFYGVLLTAFLWILFGVFDYGRYCNRRRRIELARNHPGQAGEILSIHQNEISHPVKREDDLIFGDNLPSRIEVHYNDLIKKLCEEQEHKLAEWERQKNERSDYYLMWAHQIKTPIAALKLLLEGRDEHFLMTQELFLIEQYVEMVLHYLRLESMSSDMLLQEYSLEEIVRKTVKKFSVLFINRGLSLRLSELNYTIVTDEKWLSFVLEQLLSNSIKYTQQGEIAIYIQKEPELSLVVEDTGIGIRSEDLPRIFERGFTGHNGRLDQKSTGIGLYLTKQVLEHLAIPIHVESKVGVGTKVSLGIKLVES